MLTQRVCRKVIRKIQSNDEQPVGGIAHVFEWKIITDFENISNTAPPLHLTFLINPLTKSDSQCLVAATTAAAAEASNKTTEAMIQLNFQSISTVNSDFKPSHSVK